MKLDIDGKIINIPDKELEKIKNSLECTTQDAIDVWLDDNDIVVNSDRIALDEKAKKVKIDHSANGTPRKKAEKPKTVKVSDEKAHLFEEIVGFLAKDYDICVVTDNKLVEINLNGKNFKLNLSQTREKK